MRVDDLDQSGFTEVLAGLLREFVGERRASTFISRGSQARLIGDSGVDIEDEEDFWLQWHERFGIKPPWRARGGENRPPLRRFLNRLMPEKTYVPPDITVSELQNLAKAGCWPDGMVQVETNRKT